MGLIYREKEFSKEMNDPPYTDHIVCGDSLEVLKEFPDNCVDMIITSPPYNFKMEYDKHRDSDSWDDYFKMLFPILGESIRVLRYGGRFALNIQDKYSERMSTSFYIKKFFLESGLGWYSDMVWYKQHMNARVSTFGS